MRTKQVTAIALVLVLAGGLSVWAQASRFSDVPDSHPQAHDIEHAAEQGWFAGFVDGTFRPDQTISAENALRVFNRAFPEGVTRADLSTFLRAGANQLATIHHDGYWGCVNVTDQAAELSGGVVESMVLQTLCYLRVEQQIRNGQVWVIARIQTLTDCPRGWELVVRLSPGEGLAPSRTLGTGYSPKAWAGDVLVVGVPSNMDRWETLDVTSDCHQPW